MIVEATKIIIPFSIQTHTFLHKLKGNTTIGVYKVKKNVEQNQNPDDLQKEAERLQAERKKNLHEISRTVFGKERLEKLHICKTHWDHKITALGTKNPINGHFLLSWQKENNVGDLPIFGHLTSSPNTHNPTYFLSDTNVKHLAIPQEKLDCSEKSYHQYCTLYRELIWLNKEYLEKDPIAMRFINNWRVKSRLRFIAEQYDFGQITATPFGFEQNIFDEKS